MKKLFIVLSFLAFIGSGVANALPEPTYSGWDNKSKFAQQVAGKGGTQQTVTLKWVRYSNQAQDGASIVSGDAVVYDTISDDGVSVGRSSASADGAFAGIAVVTIQTADNAQNSAFEGVGRRNWGWIIVHGKTSANTSAAGSASCSVGDGFITSSDAGQITCYQTAPTVYLNGAYTNTTARRDAIGGFVFDAPAVGDTSIDVFVEKE